MLKWLFFFISIACWSTGARADERVGAFVVFDEVQDAVLLDGEITVATPLDLRRALSLRPDAKVLVLSSPGGLVASALIIADDVHRLGMSTFIPDGFGCYSACAFIFLAGHSRVDSGELGVHQMASDVPDPSGVQYSTADILDALATFDVPPEVITRMLRTPNESMYVFTKDEVVSMGINRGGDVQVEAQREQVRLPTDEVGRSSQVRLALFEGLDFYGGDLASFRTPDAVQCATACTDDRVCKAFTYNANPNIKKGPNCFLKSGTSRPVAYRDAISGVLLTGEDDAPVFEVTSTEGVEFEQGVDYTGGDLQSTPVAGVRTAKGCSAACQLNGACKAFSFASKQKQCWLKGSVGQRERNRNIISGVLGYSTFAAQKVIPLQ